MAEVLEIMDVIAITKVPQPPDFITVFLMNANRTATMIGQHQNSGTPFLPSEAILESISDGVFTVDLDWNITSFNRAAEAITGVTRKEAIGRQCSEVFRSSMCGDNCPLQQTVKTGKPVIGTSGYIINSDGKRIPISISTAELRGNDGLLIGGAETFC